MASQGNATGVRCGDTAKSGAFDPIAMTNP
jgi:hypothetical protein